MNDVGLPVGRTDCVQAVCLCRAGPVKHLPRSAEASGKPSCRHRPCSTRRRQQKPLSSSCIVCSPVGRCWAGEGWGGVGGVLDRQRPSPPDPDTETLASALGRRLYILCIYAFGSLYMSIHVSVSHPGCPSGKRQGERWVNKIKVFLHKGWSRRIGLGPPQTSVTGFTFSLRDDRFGAMLKSLDHSVPTPCSQGSRFLPRPLRLEEVAQTFLCPCPVALCGWREGEPDPLRPTPTKAWKCASCSRHWTMMMV